MKKYVVSFKDGTVKEVTAQGLLETNRHYLLFRSCHQDRRWPEDIVAVFPKSELRERPYASDDEVTAPHPDPTPRTGRVGSRRDWVASNLPHRAGHR